MANSHGGYREPAKPAPASGPGRLSKRTDGGPTQKLRAMTGGSYGEGQAMDELQRAAPMGGTAPASAAGGGSMGVDPSSLTPLTAPTSAPEVGLLDNLDQFTPPSPSAIDDQTRAKMQAYLPTLLWLASQPGASEQTRQFVRQLRADL